MGGPVWHASVGLGGRDIRGYERQLIQIAQHTVLHGVGDAALGEWIEYSTRAMHVRRRLTPDEAQAVGPTRDVRGTAEGERRYATMERYIAPDLRAWVREELTPAEETASASRKEPHP